jgi:hypothetical protein
LCKYYRCIILLLHQFYQTDNRVYK